VSKELVTLVCPPGAESAPISHSDQAFEPYRQHGRDGLWLVDVPAEAAIHFCWNAGFRRLLPND